MTVHARSLPFGSGILCPPVPKARGRAFSSMAWTALVLSILLIPLLGLVVDGARLFYVRGRLQTAVDAACEDAAWSAADRREYRDAGVTTFQTSGGALAAAQATFNQTLGDRAAKNFTASVSIRPDYSNARMQCQAYAQVPLVTAGGLLWSPVTIPAASTAKIRFTR